MSAAIESDEAEIVHGAFARLLLRHLLRTEHGCYRDVFQHTQAIEGARNLERARNAIARNQMARQCGDVLARQEDASAVGLVEPAHYIDERRFSRTVRSDEAQNSPLRTSMCTPSSARTPLKARLMSSSFTSVSVAGAGLAATSAAASMKAGMVCAESAGTAWRLRQQFLTDADQAFGQIEGCKDERQANTDANEQGVIAADEEIVEKRDEYRADGRTDPGTGPPSTLISSTKSGTSSVNVPLTVT